jgi:CRP/FNR family cyclic AMP-dependent transcriptional regulator
MGFEQFFDYPGVEGRSVASDDLPVLGADWTAERWALLLSYSEHLRVRRGEHLMRIGGVEQALYIVEAGTFDVVVPVRAGQRRFAVGEGTVLGEVAFFDGRPRSADVVATADAEVRRLSLADVEIMSTRHPDLGRALLLDLGRILAHRLRRAEALTRA